MRKFLTVMSYILVAVLATVTTLCVSSMAGASPAAEGVNKLDQLADLIEERFIGEADRTAMEDAAAAAMVNSLGDRWSHYIPADQYRAYVETMQNAYVGIGITITVAEESDGFQVTKVNEGGPAEEAGMEPGDVIIAIDGQNTKDMTTEAARDLVRGEENTQVVITVRRGTQILDMNVTRKQVLTPVAVPTMLDNGFGLITITNFDERCSDETIASIKSLMDQGADALIFDVRFNPGGYKHELVEVLDYLLPEGPLFRSEDYKGNVHVDESDADYLDIPMAVLVNADSYSAAEFFAAALSEYEAAVIVGEPTTGKGYFQQTFQLADGSAVGLSVGKYTTPKGMSLANVGIIPDVVVEVDEETLWAIYAQTIDPNEDPQIIAAMEELNKIR